MDVILCYRETRPYRIDIDVMEVGDELVVVVNGGDKPHVGSVAIAVPRPSHKDSSSLSSTVSVYNFTGHKDDQIASPLAGLIARNCNRTAVVLAGVHIEGAREQDIVCLLDHMSKMNERIIEDLKKRIKR